jgi:hypothetical protein
MWSWSKGTQLQLELAAYFDIIHVMLVLQACKMQELQGHAGFHPDFKGRPGRPGTYDRVGVPMESPRKVLMHEDF